MSRSLELPDAIYKGLLEAAGASGVTPVDWIAERLPSKDESSPTVAERQAALARLLQHTVSLGKTTGADNQQIDIDLAREYANAHEVSPSQPTES
jgi:hypothetical protein